MGSKTQTTTQNATSSTAPPAELMAQYQQLLQQAQGTASNANSNPLLQGAYSSFGSIPNQYLPQATQYATQAASPITADQIANYSNPFQQNVIDATMANINETNAQQQNQVKGNALAQGALGGSRVGVAQAELARQQGLASNQTLAGLNTANYQQALAAAQADRSAAAQGAGLYAGLQGTALQGAQGQLAAGNAQAYQPTNWYASILGGLGPLEGGTSTTQGTTTQPGPSLFSSLLGLGTAAIGAFAKDGGRINYADGGVTVPMMTYAPMQTTQNSLFDQLMLHGAQAPSTTQQAQPDYSGIGDFATGVVDAFSNNTPLAGSSPIGQGGIGHMASGGGAFPMQDSNVHRMMTTALDIARTMKGGIGREAFGGAVNPGIGLRGYDGGGVIPDFNAEFADPDITLPTLDVYTPPSTSTSRGLNVAPASAPVPVPVATDHASATLAAPSAGIAPSAGKSEKSWKIPLIAAGLGMMASRSPFLGQAIGEGGLQGLQAYEQQKAAAAQKAQTDREFGLKERGVDLDARRLDQQARMEGARLSLETRRLAADAGKPESTAGKLAWDLKHGNITQEAYDKATAGNGVLLSPDAIDLITDQVIAGDMTAMTGYARNPVMKAQIVNALAEKANNQGLDGSTLAANAAAYMGDKAAQRSAGTRAAQVGMAASEANQMADIALDTSKAVPRGNLVPWTKAVQAFQTGTSTPEMAAFVTATTSLVNAYARAVSPLGAPTDAMRQHAEAMLNVAQGPDAYAAVIKQMKKEMEAALNAPVEIRQKLIDRGLGKTAEEPPEAAGPTSQPLPSFKEGQTATGPNGHKIVFKGGTWIDQATGQPIQ